MRVQLHRSTTRRRIITLAGLVLTVSLVGVQAAGGARSTSAARLPSSKTAAVQTGSVTEPANQPALDTAADDAKSLVGDAYYTNAVVNDAGNTVDLYLANAPQSIIDQLQAMHPGTYVIHNDAAHPLSELLKVEATLLPLGSLKSQGADITIVYPTSEGYLKVGVNGDVAAAQSTFDALDGAGVIQVYQHTQSELLLSYRYNDAPNWKGGDFIFHTGTDYYTGKTRSASCSSGINVHNTGDPNTTYMLTAAHCFWEFGNETGHGGQYTPVHNGYVESGGTVYGNGNLIGDVTKNDDDSNGATSLDAAIIQTSTGHDIFKSSWNSTGYTSITGSTENHSGDRVCTSGAFDGEICNIELENYYVAATGCDTWGCFTTYPMWSAWNPDSGSAVAAGEGDSGGPVYSIDSSGNHIARGMIEGGDPSSQVTCTSTPPGTSNRICTHIAYFVGMDAIDGDLNITPNHT